MPDPQIIESLAAAPAAEPFAGVVVQLEVTEETAQTILEAATRRGGRQQVIVTYRGLTLAEVVPIQDQRVLSYLKGRVRGQTGVPAGAVKPDAPDADWEERWKVLQARAINELAPDMTEDEIDEGIEQATLAARRDRLARHP